MLTKGCKFRGPFVLRILLLTKKVTLSLPGQVAAGSPEDQMDTLEVAVADSQSHAVEALESSLEDNNRNVSKALYLFIHEIYSGSLTSNNFNPPKPQPSKPL